MRFTFYSALSVAALTLRLLPLLLLALALGHAERVVEADKVLVLEARPARLQVEPLGARRHLLGHLAVDPAQAASVDAPHKVLESKRYQ